MDQFKRTVVKEDMVQYYLFLVQPNSLDAQANEKVLQHLLEEILAMLASYLVQYIWQQQPFNLKYHPEKGNLTRTTPRVNQDSRLSHIYRITIKKTVIHTVLQNIFASLICSNINSPIYLVICLNRVSMNELKVCVL